MENSLYFQSETKNNFADFLNAHGIHHANHYDIEVAFPYKLMVKYANYGYDPKIIQEYLSNTLVNTGLTNGSIATTGVKTYGETFEMPYSKSYDSFTLTHYMDSDGIILNIYNLWLQEIYNPQTRTVGFSTDYASTVTLSLYKRLIDDKRYVQRPVVQFTFESAYPKAINAINLQGMSGSTPTQFDVTMLCRRVHTKKVN